MPDTSSRPADPDVNADSPDRPATKRWRVGLRTLYLLIAVIATWLAVFVNRQQIRQMESRIGSMRPLARELKIGDASLIAVVQLDDVWMDENRWDLHLPAGSFRICLATREVDRQGLAPVRKSGLIRPGRHRLSMDQWQDGERWRARVACDGSELFAIEEPKEFTGNGSIGGGKYASSLQFPANQPFALYRRRFMRPTVSGRSHVPSGPTDGLMIWVEPEARPSTTP
jgi:hypothetical protein